MNYTKQIGNFEVAAGIQFNLDSSSYRDSIFITKKNYLLILKDEEMNTTLKRKDNYIKDAILAEDYEAVIKGWEDLKLTVSKLITIK